MSGLLAHSSETNESGDIVVRPQLYADHIRGVQDAVERIWDSRLSKNFVAARPYKDFERDKTAFIDAVRLAALYHDFGKLDEQCQDILRGQKISRMLNHTDAGVAIMIKRYNESGDAVYLFAAVIILAHHIGLTDMKAIYYKEQKGFLREVKMNLDLLRDQSPCSKYELGDEMVYQRVDSFLPEYERKHKEALGEVQEPTRDQKLPLSSALFSEFFFLRMGLSVLVEADHEDTSKNYGESNISTPWKLDIDERKRKMAAFVETLGNKGDSSHRNNLRDKLFQVCADYEPTSMFSLLPATVGMGKTTAGFNVICNHVKQNPNATSIIVVTPYISLNDQVGSQYRKAVTLRNEDEISVIHSLYDYKSKWMRRYAKELNAPIAVMTSVSFFDILVKNRVSYTKKLNRLAGSVIYIDEYHLLCRDEHWKATLHAMSFLRDYFSVRIIFASGTPTAFWEIDQVTYRPLKSKEFDHPEAFAKNLVVETVIDSDFYREMIEFEKNRVKVITVWDELSLDQLAEKVLSTKSGVFVVLETVDKCIRFYRRIKDSGRTVRLRHAGLTPADRRRHFEETKERIKSGEDVICIATPGGDVGLDISFRHGFRENTDIDGLCQILGRINRNSEFSDSTLTRFDLDAESGNSNPSNNINKNEMVQHALLKSGELSVEDCTCIAQARFYAKEQGDLRSKLMKLIKFVDDREYEQFSRNFNLFGVCAYSMLVCGDTFQKLKDNLYVNTSDLQDNVVTRNFYSNKDVIGELIRENKIEFVEEEIEKLHGKRDSESKFKGYGSLLYWKGEYDPTGMGVLADGVWERIR
ncbi:MAG: DEAD/DEAH box helicase [Candidatus Competibacteraceae bacterium]|nr:DEAD/DEAH box helicase [Candidatus Competibacteraceae bacterium]